MGLDIEFAKLLLDARRDGVAFDSCLTLGRQHYFLSDSETRHLFRKYGLDCSGIPGLFSDATPRYSEAFWHALGARCLETLDASDFEQATLVHDLNLPVPDSLHASFDVVCDVGTVEHVFNFPIAIRSCMEMVKPGGRLVLYTTANNYFGHGFYQFSPELFYRILGQSNGYQVERMVAVEYSPIRHRYEVEDPERIKRRVNLINGHPVLLYVQARRNELGPILTSAPQQSDYVAMWDTVGGGKKADSVARWRGLKQFLLERTPGFARFLEGFLYSSWNTSFSFRDRKAFRRLKD